MSDEQATLRGAFGVPELPPPRVRRKAVVREPIEEKLAGFIGVERARDGSMRVYTTLRSNFHYYYEGEGWAISDAILADLQEHDVARIFVHDGTDVDDDVYEFAATDYFDGESVPERDLHNEADPQTYTPEENALHVWENHAVSLFERSFEQACDDIFERRWD